MDVNLKQRNFQLLCLCILKNKTSFKKYFFIGIHAHMYLSRCKNKKTLYVGGDAKASLILLNVKIVELLGTFRTSQHCKTFDFMFL